jgi:hypothetical protein
VTPLVYCHVNWLSKCHYDAISRGAHLVSPALVAAAMAAECPACRWTSPLKWQLVVNDTSRSSSSSDKTLVKSETRAPSTGAMAVAVALRMCARVTLYGFTNMSDRNSSICSHYDSKPCASTLAQYLHDGQKHHDWAGQWRMLRDLVASGAVSMGDRYR